MSLQNNDSDHRNAFDWIWDAVIFNRDGPRCFEHLASFLLRIEYRCEDPSVTRRSKDGGIDVSFHKKGEIGLAECKRYNSKIGAEILRSFWGAKHDFEKKKESKVSHLYFFAMSEFTKGAKEFASNHGIVLCDRHELTKIIFEHRIKLVLSFIEQGLPLATKHGMYALHQFSTEERNIDREEQSDEENEEKGDKEDFANGKSLCKKRKITLPNSPVDLNVLRDQVSATSQNTL